VTKLCPRVEWLSLDSALFYNLEGLGQLPNLKLLRLNYKSRPIDQTVVDFFSLSCHNLTTLQLFDVKEIHMDDLRLTIGQCKCLDSLVLNECSLREDWEHLRSYERGKPLSDSVRLIQLISFQALLPQFVQFVNMFSSLQILETDSRDLDVESLKLILLQQPFLNTFRCPSVVSASSHQLNVLQRSFRHCSLQVASSFDQPDISHTASLAVNLLAEYADFSATLSLGSGR